MKILGKIITTFIVIFVLGFLAVATVVHFYVTDERVRAVVVPQAEKALGRTVTIGAIKIGLLSGITIEDLAVKELDNQVDFIKADTFVLSYDLMPLLQKKFVINEIRLNEPFINITRDKSGKFNFNSLALLKKVSSSPPKKTGSSSATPASLPVSLTIEKIKIVKATLVVTDAKKEIPDIKLTTDLNIALQMGSDLASLTFTGDLETIIKAKYGSLDPDVKIRATFTQDTLSYQVDVNVEGEKIHLAGDVKHFQSGAPEIICNVSSKELNIDHILALAESLPKGESAPAALGTKGKASQPIPAKEAIAKSIPAGVVAHGLISVEKALYTKLSINNLKLDYDLRQGIFTKKLSANAAGGSLQANSTVDLNTVDPAYKGDIVVGSMDLKQLGAGLGEKFAEIISGSFKSTINFAGSGIETEVLKKNLTVDAMYTVNNGRIKDTHITRAIAGLIGLSELKDLSFEEMSGKVKLLKGGKMRLVTTMSGAGLRLETDGEVDLEGNLAMPLTLNLSPELTKKLDQKGGVSKFLANDKGETELHLKLAGTVQNPKTSFDFSGVKEQLQGAVKAKAMKALGGFLSKQKGEVDQTETGSTSSESKPSAGSLFKGLLGQ